MVGHQKQYSTLGKVDNKHNVKVKEAKHGIMNMKEKKKQNKKEGNKKKEENQKTSKKMAKYKEEKEKETRGNEKKDVEKEKGDRRERKENEKKGKAHKEREANENEKEEKEQQENKKNIEEEQTEIDEQKGRKENDKAEERDEKDENDNIFCPQFYRTIIDDSSMEQVTIPLDFHKYLEEYTGVVSLRGPSGNKWRVELTKISGELCFARGWKEFLSDHRVVYGCLLVFRYDGQSQFSVTVFLPSFCEDPDASLAHPQLMDAAMVAEDEKGHRGTNSDGAPQNEEDPASEEYEGGDDMSINADGTGPQEEVEKAFSESPEKKEESEWRISCNDAVEPSQHQEDYRCKINRAPGTEQDDGFVVRKRARSKKVGDIMAELDRSNKPNVAEGKLPEAPSCDLAYEREATSENFADSEHRPPKKSKADGTRSPSGDSASKGVASSDTLKELEPVPPKKSKAERKKSTASASKGAASSASLAVPTGVFVPESMCMDLTTLHKSFGNKRAQSQFPLFNRSNDETQHGTVVIKVQRMLGLESQRRPVTQRDKEDAMNRARRFQSERPFVIKEMKHTDVYATNFMIIPHKFVEQFLPKDSRKMTLWDPQVKPWKVWYEYTGGECPRAAFSGGWGALAMENNLEKWDVCVFELLDHEYNIKLHVHRAVLEITPCVLAPKHRPQGCA